MPAQAHGWQRRHKLRPPAVPPHLRAGGTHKPIRTTSTDARSDLMATTWTAADWRLYDQLGDQYENDGLDAETATRRAERAVDRAKRSDR